MRPPQTSERKHVLVITSTFPRWEGDSLPRFVLDLCRRLSRDFDVLVIAPHYPGAALAETIDGVKVRRFRYAPVGLQVLSGVGGILAGLKKNPLRMLLVPLFMAAMLCATVRVLRSDRIDVIHAHWTIPQGLIALAARWLSAGRVKILCTSHGGDLYGLSGYLGRWVNGVVLRGSDAVTVVSTAMARTVEAGFPVVLSKVHIAPMGADLGVTFTPAGMLREPARVLFVGRLAEKKGLEVLLRAFSLVRRSCPYSTLQVIGSGPQAADLMALATNLGLEGHVSWQGSRTHQEIVQALRSAACLVFPSVVAKDGDQEGLGLVPIEALGCECPVIASDLPAVRDVIRDHETGLLVTPGSVEQLASAIELVLGDTVLATNLAKRGRDDVLKRFDWEVVGNNYKTIIHGLSDG